MYDSQVDDNMFEERLRAFSYALGTTFLILIALTVITYIWFLIHAVGAFGNIFIFDVVPGNEIARYMMNLKLLAVIFGAVYLTCRLWWKKLRQE